MCSVIYESAIQNSSEMSTAKQLPGLRKNRLDALKRKSLSCMVVLQSEKEMSWSITYFSLFNRHLIPLTSILKEHWPSMPPLNSPQRLVIKQFLACIFECFGLYRHRKCFLKVVWKERIDQILSLHPFLSSKQLRPQVLCFWAFRLQHGNESAKLYTKRFFWICSSNIGDFIENIVFVKWHLFSGRLNSYSSSKNYSHIKELYPTFSYSM